MIEQSYSFRYDPLYCVARKRSWEKLHSPLLLDWRLPLRKKHHQSLQMTLFDQPTRISEITRNDLPLFESVEDVFQSPEIDTGRIPIYEEVTPDALLTRLNEPQQRAVITTQGPVLILAGPGSGKTRVITHRIAYLIQKEKIDPKGILAMTFTNKAATEMRERLERMVGKRAHELVVTTFHSLCVRILRRSKEFLLPYGLTATFSIADDADQERIIREVIPAMDLSSLDENQKTPGALRDLISRAKGDMQTPDLLEQQALQENKYSLHLVAQVYRQYNRILHTNNLLDFDDLLLFTTTFLQREKHSLAYYQRLWKYLHVDEFQDCNYPQYLIMRLLALGTDKEQGGLGNVCVVGDDDQMIYTWRGASIENFSRFERDFPGHTVILLEENYRSSQTIVQAASSVVKENQQRRPKDLWTANDQGESVLIIGVETEDDEAEFVLDTIAQLERTKQIASWADVAVLYRTNSQSRAIEEAALHAAIPSQVVGSTMFYQRKEIKDFLAYLRVLINEKDDISLERIMNTPPRGIGKATVSALKEWAKSKAFSLSEALLRLDEWTTIGKSQKQALSHFAQMISTLRREVDELSLPDLLDKLAQVTGLEQALKEGKEEQKDRWENVLELKRVASRFAGSATPRALLLFLEHVTLMSGADHAEGTHKRQEAQTKDNLTFITHGSLIFLLNQLAKPNPIVEYSPISLEQTGLCVGFTRN